MKHQKQNRRLFRFLNAKNDCFLSNVSFMESILNFYRQLPEKLSFHDVYASMFFCDFINMIIVIAFYSQFGVSKF